MAIDANTLLQEASCFSCYSEASTAQLLELALLNRIAEGGGGGTPGGADTQVQFNDGGVFGGDADFTWNKTTNLLSITGGETITAESNETPFTISGYSLTGANAQSLMSLAGTWNTTGTPTAINLNITNTASNAASLLLALQVGGSNKFTVGPTGIVSSFDATSGGEFRSFQTDGSNYVSLKTASPKSGLFRIGLDHFLFYNTSTGDTWMSSVFGGAKLNFAISGTSIWQVANAGHFLATTDNSVDIGAAGATRPRTGYFGTGVITPIVTTSPGFTVATLPAAGTAGRRAHVTDAAAPAFLVAVVGGGAVVTPVFDNGAAWVAA